MPSFRRSSKALVKSVRESLENLAAIVNPTSIESGEWFLTSLKIQDYHVSSTTNISTSCPLLIPFLTSPPLAIHLNTFRSYDWTLSKLFTIYNNSIIYDETCRDLRAHILTHQGKDVRTKAEHGGKTAVRIRNYWLPTHILQSDGFGNDKRVKVLVEREKWLATIESMRRAAIAGKGG